MLEGNTIEVIEGSLKTVNQNTLASYISYYPETNDYRFKVKITLTQPSNYTLIGLNETRIYFDTGNQNCPEFNINTNTQGFTENGTFNFTVIE